MNVHKLFHRLRARVPYMLIAEATVSSKKSLKIPKGQSESVYRGRTDNTMVKR